MARGSGQDSGMKKNVVQPKSIAGGLTSTVVRVVHYAKRVDEAEPLKICMAARALTLSPAAKMHFQFRTGNTLHRG